MSGESPVIAWFRQDLRLADNPAWRAAAESGRPLLPVYILDDETAGDRAMGGASRWWLHESLRALDRALDGRLAVMRGNAERLLPSLIDEVGAGAICWNRCCEPWRREQDSRLRTALARRSTSVRTFNGSYLFEPPGVVKADGSPYRVFTPFWRNGCLNGGLVPRPPARSASARRLHDYGRQLHVDTLSLLPEVPWYETMAAVWMPGEGGAEARLDAFLEHGIAHYRNGRDRPDRDVVSRLSPHLHFGEISPHRVWQATAAPGLPADAVDAFRNELGWREFSCNLLYHWPELPQANLQKKFNRFPWRTDAAALEAWQQGRTGYPIVDAGMRELWQTGYLHNRVRMLAGSFLVKNLLLHWHHGERWFWDTLVDADLANNSASWQWVAGCGADAAPYFRIFNPVTQGKKFDPDGRYVRRYVPELAGLPDRHIHAPFEAPPDVLKSAGVTLGRDYPSPIVELQASRDRALQTYRSLSPRD